MPVLDVQSHQVRFIAILGESLHGNGGAIFLNVGLEWFLQPERHRYAEKEQATEPKPNDVRGGAPAELDRGRKENGAC